jgi:hypothetical protein
LRSRRIGRGAAASSGRASPTASLPLSGGGGTLASGCAAASAAGSPETGSVIGLRRRRRRRRRGAPSCARASGTCSPEPVAPGAVPSIGRVAAAPGGSGAIGAGEAPLGSCGSLAPPVVGSVESRAVPRFCRALPARDADGSSLTRQLYRSPEIKGSAGAAFKRQQVNVLGIGTLQNEDS